MLDAATRLALEALWKEGDAHDAAATDRAGKRLNITPDTGAFLYQMVRARAARRIVEVGTSNGFSTIWLAFAAEHGGRVVSIDIDPARQDAAWRNLRHFNVDERVTLVSGDADARLAELADASVDFLFLDADRRRYTAYWPQLDRVLAPRGLLVMDNALSHEEECREFVATVLATPGYLAETYPIGKGQFVILKD